MTNDINTLKLIACANAHLKVNGAEAARVPIPGTDKLIVIGNEAWIASNVTAPASADNPSTAGAAKGGITSEAFEEIAVSWDGCVFDGIEIGDALRRDFDRLAAPALNPSEARDQALAALKTISEFPVTDLIANMDAWNMKNIAIRAIKAADQQGALGEKGGDDA